MVAAKPNDGAYSRACRRGVAGGGGDGLEPDIMVLKSGARILAGAAGRRNSAFVAPGNPSGVKRSAGAMVRYRPGVAGRKQMRAAARALPAGNGIGGGGRRPMRAGNGVKSAGEITMPLFGYNAAARRRRLERAGQAQRTASDACSRKWPGGIILRATV